MFHIKFSTIGGASSRKTTICKSASHLDIWRVESCPLLVGLVCGNRRPSFEKHFAKSAMRVSPLKKQIWYGTEPMLTILRYIEVLLEDVHMVPLGDNLASVQDNARPYTVLGITQCMKEVEISTLSWHEFQIQDRIKRCITRHHHLQQTTRGQTIRQHKS